MSKLIDVPQELELNQQARADLDGLKSKEAEDFGKLDTRVVKLEQDVEWIKANMMTKPKPI